MGVVVARSPVAMVAPVDAVAESVTTGAVGVALAVMAMVPDAESVISGVVGVALAAIATVAVPNSVTVGAVTVAAAVIATVAVAESVATGVVALSVPVTVFDAAGSVESGASDSAVKPSMGYPATAP
jgi:hypothetical protein